jgi:hypothetical protein
MTMPLSGEQNPLSRTTGQAVVVAGQKSLAQVASAALCAARQRPLFSLRSEESHSHWRGASDYRLIQLI